MYKLLKAGFFRMKKDITYWLFVLLTIAVTAFILYRQYKAKLIRC